MTAGLKEKLTSIATVLDLGIYLTLVNILTDLISHYQLHFDSFSVSS